MMPISTDEDRDLGSAAIRSQSAAHVDALAGIWFDNVRTSDGQPMTRKMIAAIEEMRAAA